MRYVPAERMCDGKNAKKSKKRGEVSHSGNPHNLAEGARIRSPHIARFMLVSGSGDKTIRIWDGEEAAGGAA